jgi:hypothetical protein
MKKITILISLVLIATLNFTGLVCAKSINDILKEGSTSDIKQSVDIGNIQPEKLPTFDTTESGSVEAAQSVVFKTIDTILFIAGITAVAIIIIGGFIYVINAGMEDMQTKAKNTILYALGGLIVIFMSYAVVENVIRYLYNETQSETYEQINPLPQTELVNTDSDNDGITDLKEKTVFYTNPNSADTDNDGINDFEEIENGTDPNSASSE